VSSLLNKNTTEAQKNKLIEYQSTVMDSIGSLMHNGIAGTQKQVEMDAL